MSYVRTLKRIRSGKTNYRKRAALLIGRHSFITINVSDQNVSVQLLRPTQKGDLVIVSCHSNELKTFGWKGSCNNLPACYLTGLIMGRRAVNKGADSAVLYIGKKSFTTRIAACLKGILDGGLNIPVSDEILPPEERLNGTHVSEYAKLLKNDEEKYQKMFSKLLKNDFDPERYPQHFGEVRSRINEQIDSNKDNANSSELSEDRSENQ